MNIYKLKNMAKGKKKSAKKRDIKSEQKSEEVVADKSLNIPLKTEGLATPKSGLEPSKGSEDLVLKHKVFHMPALANDIYITRNKPLIVYQKRLEKLFFNLNYQAVNVYATGAAINIDSKGNNKTNGYFKCHCHFNYLLNFHIVNCQSEFRSNYYLLLLNP